MSSDILQYKYIYFETTYVIVCYSFSTCSKNIVYQEKKERRRGG